MVKRIKKRIPKQVEPEETLEEGLEEGGPVPEIEGDDPELYKAGEGASEEDLFTRKTTNFVQWLIGNSKALLAVAAVIAVALAVYVFTQGQSKAASEEAAAAFQDGAGPYTNALLTPDGPEGDALKGQLEKARKAFKQTQDKYGDEPIATVAALGQAGAAFELGEVDEAIKLYDAFLARADTDPFARGVGLQGKAIALEQKGDIAGAITTWKSVEGTNRKVYGLMAGMQVGRLLEAQGKKADALTHYTQLKKAYAEALEEIPNRGVKSELERRSAALGAS